MTGVRHPLVERIDYHGHRLRAWAKRATRIGLLVRAVVWVTGAGALATAAPPWLEPVGVVLAAGALAALAAGWPGSGWATAVALAALAALAAGLAGPEAGPGPVVAAAGLLYLHHTSAALAAQLRVDTLVAPVVLRRWALRAAVVVCLSVPVWALVLTAPYALPRWPVTGLVLLGSLAAVLTTAALCYMLLRRPTGT